MTLVCFAPYTMLMHNNTRSSGFTIIELIVVIIVLGILVGITIVSYNGAQGRARDADRRVDVANLVKALEMYYDDNGRYPTASGTNSTAGSIWYSSDTTSWSTFATALAGILTPLPSDPLNKAGNIRAANSPGLNYAYYGNTSTYCGATAGQMYIIEYRLEASAKEKFVDGTCNTNNIWNIDHNNGASYYLVVKNGS